MRTLVIDFQTVVCQDLQIQPYWEVLMRARRYLSCTRARIKRELFPWRIVGWSRFRSLPQPKLTEESDPKVCVLGFKD